MIDRVIENNILSQLFFYKCVNALRKAYKGGTVTVG